MSQGTSWRIRLLAIHAVHGGQTPGGTEQEYQSTGGPNTSFHIEDYVGQEHIMAPGKLLRRSIEADRIQSLILYGPPGTGKTTLAQIIAHHPVPFERLSGVESNVAEMRRTLATATQRLAATGQSTLLFVDEIHRFNKSQQDVLLPDVESGVIQLIGATTHNPFSLSMHRLFPVHKSSNCDPWMPSA